MWSGWSAETYHSLPFLWNWPYHWADVHTDWRVWTTDLSVPVPWAVWIMCAIEPCYHASMPEVCQCVRKTSVGCSEPPVTTKSSQGVPEVQIEGHCATVPDGTELYLIDCGSLFTLHVMGMRLWVMSETMFAVYSLVDCNCILLWLSLSFGY